MAKPSARGRCGSERSASATCCHLRTRSCNTAMTRLGTVVPFTNMPAPRALEGIISKRADAPYAPGNRGLWLKVKCLNREEFVVIGWTDPEGSRPHLGALLLGYYEPDGRLVYAGRAGTGINHAELERLWRRLQSLTTPDMP